MTKQQHQGPAGAPGKAGGGVAAAAADEGPLGRRGLIDRREFLRLLEQSLAALGYTDIAEQLERASGVASQPWQVRAALPAARRPSLASGSPPAWVGPVFGRCLPLRL